MKLSIFWAAISLIFTFASAAEPTELTRLVELAYSSNLTIKQQQQLLQAEKYLDRASGTPEDPIIGISQLDRNMKTQYGTISQKIRFPYKYYLQSKAQNYKGLHAKAQLLQQKLAVKKEVTRLFYSIYATQKIIGLTKANMESVKEFARVAEKKYAAGKSSQGDSMKAHFELTNLELELIRLRQQEEALQKDLSSVVNQENLPLLDFESKTVETPAVEKNFLNFNDKDLKIVLANNSQSLKAERQLVEFTEYKAKLAKWEFAPDFQVQYQKALSGEPSDSQIFSLGITFPLWFWGKSAQASYAIANNNAQEARYQQKTLDLLAKIQDLLGKVKAEQKILKIYQTSLIPQAQGAYNSSRSAYQANRTSFLDLLDSERSLYRVKTGFYQSLILYASHYAQLEQELGASIKSIGHVTKEVRHEK